MHDPIISVSGLRGIVGQSLTPPIASAYAASFASSTGDGDLVVTRDGRPSGKMLAEFIGATFAAMGRNVVHGGIAATPTTGTLIRRHRAAGGVQISASHNPSEYNGIKLFSGEGRVLSAEHGERILQHYLSSKDQQTRIAWAAHDRLGTVSQDPSPHQAHMELVLDTVDVERIKAANYRVLLDSNHGAGGLLGKPLLEALGCSIVAIGDQADGLFAHVPEPTADNLGEIAKKTAAEHCQIGFCQDPDADRLALIDETGRYVGEEYTVALCADQVLTHRQGAIVTNCSTSRMTQDLANRHGVPFFRSKVGEANVADLMIAKNAIFGGEGNGGPIDPRVGYVRDSFVGMALVLSLLAERRQPLSALVDALPRYAIHKTKVPMSSDAMPEAVARLKRRFSEAQADELDGLRLDWPDKWLLVRASNTEPIVRLIAEAKTAAAAEQLCAQAGQECPVSGQSAR